MFTGEKTFDFAFVAALTCRVTYFVDPTGWGRRLLILMAIETVDSGACMRRSFPIVQQLRIGCNACRRILLSNRERKRRLIRMRLASCNELPRGNHTFGQESWFVAMLEQEVFIQRRVIVEIVAAGAGASFETKIGVTGAILGDVNVTVKTIIIRKGHSHCSCFCRPVLLMTRDALAGVENGDPVSVAGIGEFAFRVGVINGFEFVPMTGETRLLRNAHEWGVTSLTGLLDLVMS